MIEFSSFIGRKFIFKPVSVWLFSKTTKVEFAERGLVPLAAWARPQGTRALFHGTECVKLNSINQFFHRILQLMMLYYQTKSGSKLTSSLEDTVEQSYFDYIRPHCDLDTEDSEPVFLHDIPTPDNTPPHQIWLKNFQWFRRYLHTWTGW